MTGKAVPPAEPRSPSPQEPSIVESLYRNVFQNDIYLQTNTERIDNAVLFKYIKAILPGMILLLSYGTQTMWGLHLMPYNTSDHYHYETSLKKTLMVLMYYLGGIIGIFVGAALIESIQKNSIYKINIFVTIVVGTLFLTSNSHEWMLMIARATAGFSHSITLITVLIHATEVASHQTYRHKVLLIVGLSLAFSNLLPAILIPRIAFATTNVLIGSEYMILAVIAFAANSYYTKESPSFLLYRTDASAESESQSTYDLFKFLQTGPVPVFELHTEFERFKSYVQLQRHQSWRITTNGNLRSLLLCINARMIGMFSFNLATCYYVICVQNLSFSSPDHNSSLLLVLFYLTCGSITTIFTHDNRQRLYIVLMAFASIHAVIFVATVMDDRIGDYNVTPWPLIIGIVTGLFYVYCFAMPLDIRGWIVVSEAFPLAKKPLSIAVTIMVEHLVHVLMIVLAVLGYSVILWMIVVFGLLVGGWISYDKLPKTTDCLPLEKCPDAYKPLER